MLRAAVHYLLAGIFLTIYGGQVCPFLESLLLAHLAMVIFGWLAVAFLIRQALVHFLIDPLENYLQAGRLFYLEFSIFVTSGLVMAIFNVVYFSFPIGSGMKLVLGCAVMGLFAAADLALSRERKIASMFKDTKQHQPTFSKYFPVTRKIAYMVTSLTVFTAGILTLVILHDLNWIRQLPPDQPLTTATRSIIIEISFVLGVILTYLINIILSYAKNIKLYFDRQTNVLEDVASGILEGHVPITTNDEFAVIGTHTNNMIEELRERAFPLKIYAKCLRRRMNFWGIIREYSF